MLRVLRHGLRILLLLALSAGCVPNRAAHNKEASLHTFISCAYELCVDDGFDVSQDGFSFANWNDTTQPHSTVDVQMLVTMFGHSVVCRPGSERICVPTPRTLHLIDEWNAALTGGRCEGMATLSERMFIDLAQPHDFDTSLNTASQLSRGNKILENEITYWWATQFTDEITSVARESRTRSPSDIVNELIQGLSSSAGYTLALYDKGMGHSLTPYAVSATNDGWRIHVYDNNYPNIENYIDVNAFDESWSYHPRQSSNDNVVRSTDTQLHWTGSTGSIELTPMRARSGPFQCATCNDQSGESRNDDKVTVSLVTLSRYGEVGLEITTEDGVVTTLHHGPHENNGIEVMVSKDGTAPVLTRVRIPSSIESFDVRVIASSLTVLPPPVLLTVSQPEVASVHLRGVFARPQHPGASKKSAGPVLSIRQSGLRFRTDVAASASIAITSDIADVEIQSGHSLIIDKRTTSDVSIMDENKVKVFSRSYNMKKLEINSVLRRHIVAYEQERYRSTDVVIPAVEVSTTPSTDIDNQQPEDNRDRIANNTLPINTEQGENPAVSPQPQQAPTSSTTSGTTQTTSPTNDALITPTVMAEFSAPPHLLHVDKDDAVWLRVGSQRSVTRIASDGSQTQRIIDGIPIAMTEDDVGTYWMLLQQPERLARITPTSIDYFAHPQLLSTTSIAFSPRERHLVVTGGRNAVSYVAFFSSTQTFHFVRLENINHPGLITLDAQSHLWFADVDGGSISKIGANQSVETFRRSTVMPRSLTLGPDNALWFVNNIAGQNIGRISSKGTFSFVAANTDVDTLRGIAGTDDALWLTARGVLVKMTTDKATTVIPDTHAWGQSLIASRSKHTLWFTNANFFTVSRITM